MEGAGPPANGAAANGAAEKVHKFPCRQCGADLVFSAADQNLRCQYCGYVSQIPRSKEAIVEYEYNEAFAPARQKGWGTERRSVKCENCGATSSEDPAITATKCAFCGSPKVIEQTAAADVVRPESMVPFQIDKQKARDGFRRWLSSLWFRPSNLTKESSLASLSGVYIPYWTFDAYTNSYWEADAGYYYYTTESYTEGGHRKTRQVRHVRWEHAEGAHDEFFDDELVCASTGLPEGHVRVIQPFDTTKLVPYEAGFLSGWKAESYAVELKVAWQRAKSLIADKIRSACSAKVPGDTQRNLHVETAYSGITYKHVLLPIWVAAFQYGPKTYRVVINGQTGRVSGSAPYSWLKIAAAVVTALIVLAIVAKLAG
ncbi:MAG: zinc ribbon domain-containing protein [Acidobacteria bacterium]|nr:zinc ribbon domain-containing protein [Acidobacteriota bacterium]